MSGWCKSKSERYGTIPTIASIGSMSVLATYIHTSTVDSIH